MSLDQQLDAGAECMGRFAVEFTVINNRDSNNAAVGALAPDAVRTTTLEGVVDTGATRLVLPETVADQLGLVPAGEATVRYAERRHGGWRERSAYGCWIARVSSPPSSNGPRRERKAACCVKRRYRV